jgi:hypothetical protein
MKLLKSYTHYIKNGSLLFDQNLQSGLHQCQLGIAFDIFGKIWFCMNSKSIMRFRLIEEPTFESIKPFRSYYQTGDLYISKNLQRGIVLCNFKTSFNRQGAIWLYINNELIVNFQPHQSFKSKMSDASDDEVKNAK